MIRTRVGYTGGTKAQPTYRDMGDHSEAIQIDFDPQVIAYEKLLSIFWASHSPTRASWSRQYRSAIHPHDAEQERVARASLAAEEKRRGTRIHTTIEREAVDAFTYAEDYHQKYQLRHSELGPFFAKLYGGERAFTDATAVARANALAAGYGKADAVLAALPEEARATFAALTDG